MLQDQFLSECAAKGIDPNSFNWVDYKKPDSYKMQQLRERCIDPATETYYAIQPEIINGSKTGRWQWGVGRQYETTGNANICSQTSESREAAERAIMDYAAVRAKVNAKVRQHVRATGDKAAYGKVWGKLFQLYGVYCLDDVTDIKNFCDFVEMKLTILS